jgi:predicted RNA-binding Zn-ribbon protein involved in translation (DUF1610 family)
MSRYVQWCPSCGTRLPPDKIPVLRAYSFSCPFCGAPLRLAARHEGARLAGSLILSLIVTFLLGFRGLTLVLVAIAGFLLLYLFISPFMLGFVDPAKIELRPPTDSPLRFPTGPRE